MKAAIYNGQKDILMTEFSMPVCGASAAGD